VAFENVVIGDVYHNVEVAGRSAIEAGFAVAAGSKFRTRVDTGRHLHLDLGRGVDPTLTAAVFAGFVDARASAVTVGAGLPESEKSAGRGYLAAAATSRAARGFRSFFGTASIADIARNRFAKGNLFLHAGGRLFK
jgi:hypothetical protein